MAITITPIDPNDAIANGPAVINQNFQAIETHINDLEALLNPVNNSLKLTNLATIPANSIESATITLSALSGNVLAVSPNGGPIVASLDAVGVMTALKFLATGAGAGNKSVLQQLQVQDVVELDAAVTVMDLINLNTPNGRMASKYSIVSLVNANMGPTATTKVDISKMSLVFLDFSAVSVTTGVSFDFTNVVDGQEFTFICLKNAGGGTQALDNGTTGNEIYAYINPTTGFVTVSAAVTPQFIPAASPNELSFMKFKWMNIGGGNFRLVSLDQQNTSGLA